MLVAGQRESRTWFSERIERPSGCIDEVLYVRGFFDAATVETEKLDVVIQGVAERYVERLS